MKTDASGRDGVTSGLEGELSVAQQAISPLENLNPQHPVFNVSSGLRLRGSLDQKRLIVALRVVFQRYEVLHTIFPRGEAEPVSSEMVASTIRVENLQDLSLQDREVKLSNLATREAQRPFEIETDCPIRATLWHLSTSDHVLLLVAHGLICDRRSLEILLNDIGEQYATGGCCKKVTQFREFNALQKIPSPEGISFWTNYLAGAPPNLELFTDHPRPSKLTLCGGVHVFSIPKAIVEQFRNVATACGTNLSATLLAAFKIVLCRYSRQSDVIVGIPVSGRLTSAFEDAVGPLEHMIALRTDISGDPTFDELLSRVHDSIQKAEFHEDVRFEVLLKYLQVQRDPRRNPIFQVAYCFRRHAGKKMWSDDVYAMPFEPIVETERFDLSLDLIDTDDSVEGRLSYNADLWEAGMAARMAEHFTNLLAGIVANPDMQISQIPLLSESERQKVLSGFSSISTKYQTDFLIHEFFEQQVERTPAATAIICGNQCLTYRELNSRANQLAHYLTSKGVGPETLVAVCLERSIEMVIGILAILKAGGAYVPLDPTYPQQRLAAILEDAEAFMLLTQRRLKEVIPQNAAPTILVDAISNALYGQPTANPLHDVRSNNLDYVLFTSGSTGRPKGVALEHKSGAVLIQWARELFRAEELSGTLFATSICFDLSVFELFVPLSVGATVIVAQDALALPRLVASDKVTLINTVPSAIAELLRMGGIPKSAQVINLAGEPLHNELAHQIYQKTKVQKIYNLYGPTEDTTYSTAYLVPRGGEVTIGRPLPNTYAYILEENGEPAPIGVPGELYLAGDGLARAYWGREDLTKERFVHNPFSARLGMRMYRTGDLARFLEDGNIQYLGRIDDQVKVRGFRIELGEIEAVLARHPSVRYAVVSVCEDVAGNKRLVAYIVPSGNSFSSSVLRTLASRELPAYMVPSAVVGIEKLPLSPNGKINRKALPAPDWTRVTKDAGGEPRDQIEVVLMEIWRDALGIDDIGVADNFFDLGGDSLIAARILTEAETLTGREIPPSVLLHYPTVEALAGFIRKREHNADPVVMQIQAGDRGRIPFLAIVPPGEEALGFAILARHMGKEQPVYKIQGHSPITNGKRPYSDEEMRVLTEECIAAIRTVQPKGPYCLGGMCDGTHIAEQIVLRLEAQGDGVGLFAIFDTWVLQHSQRRWLWKLDYYRQRLRQMHGLDLVQRFAPLKRVAKRKVENLVTQDAPRTGWKEAYWPKNFVPMRFCSPVILFKRPVQPFYYIEDRQMGWGARTESGVEIYELDFDHDEILREPHVRVFATKLLEHLSRITSSTSLNSTGTRRAA